MIVKKINKKLDMENKTFILIATHPNPCHPQERFMDLCLRKSEKKKSQIGLQSKQTPVEINSHHSPIAEPPVFHSPGGKIFNARAVTRVMFSRHCPLLNYYKGLLYA